MVFRQDGTCSAPYFYRGTCPWNVNLLNYTRGMKADRLHCSDAARVRESHGWFSPSWCFILCDSLRSLFRDELAQAFMSCRCKTCKKRYMFMWDELEQSSGPTASRQLSTVHALLGALSPVHMTFRNSLYPDKDFNLRFLVSTSMRGTMMPSVEAEVCKLKLRFHRTSTACIQSLEFNRLLQMQGPCQKRPISEATFAANCGARVPRFRAMWEVVITVN